MTKPIIGIGTDVQSPTGERERAFIYLTYVEALRRAGAIPVLVPPQPENATDLVEELDGVLLAGGEDCDPALFGEQRHPTVEPMDPRRQTNDVSLARAARERGIPTLGICLGVQVMNVAAGGSLVQDIDSQMETEIRHASDPEDRARHDVLVEQGTKLAKILGERELNVNSSHHQAIKRVGEGLRVTALAPDGVIEGLEDPKHPFYVGVQWHPEDMSGEPSAAGIFGAFVDAARRYAEQKQTARSEMSQEVTPETVAE
ncbi:MAG TPA: gamma-glutamyl-gamma-aminobutyrate hydrolase family protein [Thermoanaerobaculia bacterium]|nr:gamma-glutamyl-gamma-aminobutyrate hydrolase family protein [Thermoanaerobaculia bacterium]